MPTVLETKDITKRFGGLTAIDHCSVKIEEKTVVGVIGPNGAGKTTFFNLINGIYKPDSGKIYFKNKCVDGKDVHELCRAGIARTFQLPTVFRGLTLMDNLVVGGIEFHKDIRALRSRAMDLLNFVGLDRLKDELASDISIGQQKLLDLARALVSDPGLILLDEPFHGIHPTVKERICEDVRIMNEERGKTFLLVSHDMPSITSVCQRIIVLCAGQVIADGCIDEVRKDKRVIESYMGI